MKLWQKKQTLNELIEAFTVGNDHILDQRLVAYDCRASMAHANMLAKTGIIDGGEAKQLCAGLQEIISLAERGEFPINRADEDCHTAIENYLTSKLGDTGKKIHTARSRNDQVLTAMRLYEKEALMEVHRLLTAWISGLEKAIQGHGKVAIPGYTHMQRAMPTSVGVWLGSFVDAARDNLDLLDAVLKLVDQSPLGSAAGFGVPVLDIKREDTAREMGFARVQDNPMYCQLSRGKFEAAIINVCSMVMHDLNRVASDLAVFSMREFGFIELPEEFCTGSSIMPQKKNPDVLELVRAHYHMVIGEEIKLKSLTANLISGYNRDLQLTKEPLFNALDTTLNSLSVMSLVVQSLQINKENCAKAMTEELHATAAVYGKVKAGMPFRDAYREIAARYRSE